MKLEISERISHSVIVSPINIYAKKVVSIGEEKIIVIAIPMGIYLSDKK